MLDAPEPKLRDLDDDLDFLDLAEDELEAFMGGRMSRRAASANRTSEAHYTTCRAPADAQPVVSRRGAGGGPEPPARPRPVREHPADRPGGRVLAPPRPELQATGNGSRVTLAGMAARRQ